jgi:hypothetical protein
VKHDPSTNNKNSKMIKSLEKLSQILAVDGISISASQEEQILTAVKNVNFSPHPQEDIKVSFDPLCQYIEEIKKSWTEFDGEKPLEPKIKEFLICLSEDPPCIDETSYSKEDDLHGMIEGDM